MQAPWGEQLRLTVPSGWLCSHNPGIHLEGTHMGQSHTPTTDPAPNSDIPPMNYLEIIRFPSAEARVQAIGVLLDRGMLNFSTHSEYEWLVSTTVARALRALGVPFEWPTQGLETEPAS